MKMRRINFSLLLFFIVLLLGCREEEDFSAISSKDVIEKTVAVILPMDNGFEEHWSRCLDLYTSNLERAYKNQDTMVKLNFEFYDESSENLTELANSLGHRDDVYAVIGGLYSSDASVLTAIFSRLGKTFFTFATSEDIVRAYASTGYLWAMVETDITQCEVLLSKVVNYGGRRVTLIAKEDDVYGKTFLDWFAFQARELGLESGGVYAYSSTGDLPDAMAGAFNSDADYVICVPSDIEDIGYMIKGYNDALKTSENAPRLLFSDTGYGIDVINLYGDIVEGMEGVAFGADPESGFDVSYNTFFGVSPTTGEAHLYDSAMLLGYACWLQHLHPGLSLQEALRNLVSGEEMNMGSWTGEDMSLVVDALASGASPYIRGASGNLKFDKKIFTNVLSTTYYNYRVYEGSYIIVDYNTSDGGNRTDATLAGWNWKASQIQEFESDNNITYPDLEGNWALLVATSNDWTNYRHQADVLAIYQQLKQQGYDDDHIILIAEDDLAYHISNPEPGIIRVKPGGENVYENVKVDYLLSQVNPTDLISILKGESSDRLPVVLESGKQDNVFVFWSGHGVPGAMCWRNEKHVITSEMLRNTLLEMNESGRYRKLLMMVEACYSGGIMKKCEGVPGALFITAAGEEETSKADIFNSELGVWMSNRFTSTFIEQISENSALSLRDLYYRLFINTVGSHVMVYNAVNFGSLYLSDMSEFINYSSRSF